MKMIIGDKFLEASNNETIPDINHYDGRYLETIHHATREDVELAVQCAIQAQKSWKNVPVYERVELAMKFVELVRQHKEELAETMTRESGKTITESRNEINNVFTAWPVFCEK